MQDRHNLQKLMNLETTLKTEDLEWLRTELLKAWERIAWYEEIMDREIGSD